MNIERIAASTPRLEALIFGMGDYSASQGVAVRRSAALADIRATSGTTSAIAWRSPANRLASILSMAPSPTSRTPKAPGGMPTGDDLGVGR